MFPQLDNAEAKFKRTHSEPIPGEHMARKMKTREIHNANNARRGRENKGWAVGAEAERLERREREGLNKKMMHFEQSDLNIAFETFLVDRESRRHKLDDDRWHTVVGLQRVLEKPVYSGVRLAGGDRALYERMFRSEPKKYITRERFFSVMWRVFGFEIAEMEGVADSKALNTLNRLYDAFDTERLQQMDWRCFLIMLRMVQESMSSPREHLLWGFAIFSSEGSMDFSCTVSARQFPRRSALQFPSCS